MAEPNPIDDETFRRAVADSLRENEELLRRLAAGQGPAATFEDAAGYVLAKNAELYRRLAQH